MKSKRAIGGGLCHAIYTSVSPRRCIALLMPLCMLAAASSAAGRLRADEPDYSEADSASVDAAVDEPSSEPITVEKQLLDYPPIDGLMGWSKIEDDLLEKMSVSAEGDLIQVGIWITPVRDPGLLAHAMREARLNAQAQSSASPNPQAGGIDEDFNADTLQLIADTQQPILDFLNKRKIKLLYASIHGPAVFAEMTPSQIRELAQMVDVEGVYLVRHHDNEIDTAAKTARADIVWSRGINGGGVLIAVCEGGRIAFPSPYLLDGDYYNPPANPASALSYDDHTTCVAGIIAANDATPPLDRWRGMAWGAPALLSANTGSGFDHEIVSAMDWAVSKNAIVYNLSFGGNTQLVPSLLDRYLDYLVRNNFKTIVKSAGNRGRVEGNVTSPGLGYNVLAVGSYDDKDNFRWNDDAISPFSSWRNPLGRVISVLYNGTSTGLTGSVLTDSAAAFGAVDGLVGKFLIPNTAHDSAFLITGNTATTISVRIQGVGTYDTSTQLTDTLLTDTGTAAEPNPFGPDGSKVGMYINPNVAQNRAFLVVANTGTTLTVAAGSGMTAIAAAGDRYELIFVDADLTTSAIVGNSYQVVDASAGDRQKPEVSAVGQSAAGIESTARRSAAGGPAAWIKNQGQGTSYAAPQVVGEAALIISRANAQGDNALRAYPEAIKSIIMASACHELPGDTNTANRNGTAPTGNLPKEKMGAGGIVACEADEITRDHRYFYGYLSSSDFNVNGEYSRTISLKADLKARVVLNWNGNPTRTQLNGTSTGLTATTLTDTNANFGPVNSKRGWVLNPNTAQANPKYYAVVGNSANSLTIGTPVGGEDMTTVAVNGDSYRLLTYPRETLDADLDLRIWDPVASAYIATSLYFDNSYEIVEFTPNRTGNYDIRVDDFRWNGTLESIGLAWTQEPCCSPDWGDAPDDMMTCSPRPKRGDFPTRKASDGANASEFEVEWLSEPNQNAPGATWETDAFVEPYEVEKDQDGVDNIDLPPDCVPNGDGADDGVQPEAFYIAGSKGRVTFYVNSATPDVGRYSDARDTEKIFVRGWFDWEHDDTSWAGNSMVGVKCGPGVTAVVLAGTCVEGGGLWPQGEKQRKFVFEFDVPDFDQDGPFWIRFRMNYGEDITYQNAGAGTFSGDATWKGNAVYGEVEDHVSEQYKFSVFDCLFSPFTYVNPVTFSSALWTFNGNPVQETFPVVSYPSGVTPVPGVPQYDLRPVPQVPNEWQWSLDYVCNAQAIRQNVSVVNFVPAALIVVPIVCPPAGTVTPIHVAVNHGANTYTIRDGNLTTIRAGQWSQFPSDIAPALGYSVTGISRQNFIVPPPICDCPGDLDGTGAVGMGDVPAFVSALLNSTFDVCADTNEDGFENGADVQSMSNYVLAYGGLGSPCESGACCVPDGNCYDAFGLGDCLAAAGAFHGGGSVCALVDCAQPSGACCNSGVCTLATELSCVSNGGYWGGPNTTCVNIDCDPVGACCLVAVDIICIDGQSAASCDAAGGQYHGVGSVCTDSTCMPLDCIPAGQDCWVTTCGQTLYAFTDMPLPAGFFGPGSDPFTGTVYLGGVPIGPNGTDTLVQRHGQLCFSSNFPSTDTVAIELIAMSLVSCQPISVTSNGGANPQQWSVAVDLSTIPAPLGSITVTKTHPDGGTFDTIFYVQPRFTFTKVTNPAQVVVLDTGLADVTPMQLSSTGHPWLHTGSPGSQCSPGFAPGFSNPAAPCCSEECHSSGGSAPHDHCVKPPSCSNCPGACCLPDGTCQDNFPDPACANANGSYQGDGTSCLTTNCTPTNVGACCRTDNTCVDGQTAAACATSGSTYQGDGSSCATVTCPTYVCIPGGDDCWTTPCPSSNYSFAPTPLPAGFFGPGSDPFTGLVVLGGSPSGPFGSDTTIRRLGDLCFSQPIPSNDTVAIEIISLSLISCQPITVTFNGGQNPQQWNVNVGLSPTPAPPGSLTATMLTPSGGTFSSVLFVQPLFTFTRVGPPGTATLDTGAQAIPPMQIGSAGAPWTMNPVPGPSCSPNFHPGYEDDPVPCCPEVCHSSFGSAPHDHCVRAPDCPCGACCLPAGGCVENLTSTECSAQGGVFQGGGIPCAGANCSPTSLGACCLTPGGCSDGQSPANCVNSGGAFQGDGSTCATVNCPTYVCVTAGQDCWTTACPGSNYSFQPTPVPAGFFGPGSDPFTGLVTLGGSPSGPFGSDTIIQRLGDLCFQQPIPSSDVVPIQLVALSLVSCQPITVTYNGGQNPEQWNVSVGLSPTPAPLGSINATMLTPTGGTFNSVIFVQPLFTFSRVGPPQSVTFDTGAHGIPPMQIGSTGTPWTTNPVGGPSCSPGFNPGYTDEPVPCCHETCHSSFGSAPHDHCVRPSECPHCNPNDECSAATPLVIGSFVTGSNASATDDATPPACGVSTPNQAMWYSVIGNGDQLTISTCNPGTNFDTMVEVFGGVCAAPTCIGGNDDAQPTGDPACSVAGSNLKSRFTFCSQPGVNYLLRVSGFGTNSGTFELSVSDAGPCVTAPPHDSCVVPIIIGDGFTPFSTVGATTDGPSHSAAQCQFNNPVYNNVWYQYTASCSGNLTITNCEQLGGNANYDSRIAVYGTTDCSQLEFNLVGCNDDDTVNPCGDGPAFHSTVNAPVVAGGTYLISVGAFSPTGSGSGSLLISCSGGPLFGACCFGSSCSDGWDSIICSDNGGLYQGNGSNCGTVVCSPPAFGACCFGIACAEGFDAISCSISGGLYVGDGSNCLSNPCGGFGPTVLNEIRIDQPSGDVDEYFEITGIPGTSLSNLTYLVIGDDAAVCGTGGCRSGVIETIVPLAGFSIPPSGRFLAATRSPAINGQIPDYVFPLVVGGTFENQDNVTHLLVANFSGTPNQIIDTDRNGVIDVFPWTDILDWVSFERIANPPSSNVVEWVYTLSGPSGAVVPIGTTPLTQFPGHVYRRTAGGQDGFGAPWLVGGFGAPTNDSPGFPN